MKNIKSIIRQGLFILISFHAATLFAAPPTYHVYATREGLVGGRTANGHIIASNDHFCALPSGTVLNANGGYTYTVTIRNPANGRVANNVPVWDIGPWNTKDNYWHSPRAMWTDLARGLPEAQAAYQNGYNNRKDEFGRTVANPAGIDLADGTFYDLGSPTWVDVTYNWENVIDIRGGPDADSRYSGNVEMFVRRADNHLMGRAYNNGWGGWVDHANNCSSDPSVVSWNSDRLDVFWRGTDGALWVKGWTSAGGWGVPVSLGGALVGGPDACSMRSGNIEVFCRGTDNTLQHRSYNGSWTGWESLGGALTGDPSAVSWADGRIDVFVRDTSGAMEQKTWTSTGGWSGWILIGGQIIGSPDACSMRPGRLDIFVRELDNSLGHISWEGGWSGWESLGGIMASDPGATSWGNNRIDVFVRGTGNEIDQKTWTSTSGWSGWINLGVP